MIVDNLAQSPHTRKERKTIERKEKQLQQERRDEQNEIQQNKIYISRIAPSLQLLPLLYRGRRLELVATWRLLTGCIISAHGD